jgi:hypothetical protein
MDQNCYYKIREYKAMCSIVYDDYFNTFLFADLDKLTVQDIMEYIHFLSGVADQSKMCAILRIEYKATCIPDENNDPGHVFAIVKAAKMSLKYVKELERVREFTYNDEFSGFYIPQIIELTNIINTYSGYEKALRTTKGLTENAYSEYIEKLRIEEDLEYQLQKALKKKMKKYKK